MNIDADELKKAISYGYLTEIRFNDFIFDTEYEIMLLNFNNATPCKYNRDKNQYMLVEGYSLHDYLNPILMTNRKVTFNFSIATFLFAWYRINNRELDMTKNYNLRLRFKREN